MFLLHLHLHYIALFTSLPPVHIKPVKAMLLSRVLPRFIKWLSQIKQMKHVGINEIISIVICFCLCSCIELELI